MMSNTGCAAQQARGGKGAPSRREMKRVLRATKFERSRDFIERQLPFEMRERAIRGWAEGPKRQLALLLEALGSRRENGRTASHRTRESRGEVLFPAFADLRALGFKIDNVLGFRTAHVQALLRHWVADGVASSTINQRLSVLRIFAGWIGKPGLVPPVPNLGAIGFDSAIASRHSSAQSDKSWDRPGIDKAIVFAKVEQFDLRYGLIFQLADMFGLRKQEALRWCPHEDDWEGAVEVRVGAKNGKRRRVPFAEGEAKALIDRCKAAVPPRDSMSGKTLRSLEQARARFSYVARRFGICKADLGITAHGLRHGYVHRRMKALTGEEAPVKDPDAPWPRTPQARAGRRALMEEVGHSRPTIIRGYAGAARVGNREALRQDAARATSIDDNTDPATQPKGDDHAD